VNHVGRVHVGDGGDDGGGGVDSVPRGQIRHSPVGCVREPLRVGSVRGQYELK
jgi:hypothetical protein